MSRVKQGVGAAAAASAGMVARKVLARTGAAQKHDDPARWRAVTVCLPTEQVPGEGGWPAPLAEWGDAVEIRTRPAPGDKGTEIHVRLRDPEAEAPEGLDGETPVQKLRSALRRSKQLLETGEVLRATEPGTSHPTAMNAPLRAATHEAGGEGVL